MAAMYDIQLELLMMSVCTDEYPVYDLHRPSVCRSSFKRHKYLFYKDFVICKTIFLLTSLRILFYGRLLTMDKTVLVWLVYLYQNLYLVNVNIIAKLCKLFEDFLMQ